MTIYENFKIFPVEHDPSGHLFDKNSGHLVSGKICKFPIFEPKNVRYLLISLPRAAMVACK